MSNLVGVAAPVCPAPSPNHPQPEHPAHTNCETIVWALLLQVRSLPHLAIWYRHHLPGSASPPVFVSRQNAQAANRQPAAVTSAATAKWTALQCSTANSKPPRVHCDTNTCCAYTHCPIHQASSCCARSLWSHPAPARIPPPPASCPRGGAHRNQCSRCHPLPPPLHKRQPSALSA